jgi:hypothetical protein
VTALPTLARNLLDRWVLLHGAEAQAEALPPGRRAGLVALHEAARTRVDAALGEYGVSALLLARAALPLALEAAVTARSSDPPASGTALATLWEQYDALVSTQLAPAVPASLTPARDHSLSSQTVDAEIAEHGDARIDETLALVAFLLESVELRTPRAIRMQRALRRAAGVLVAAGLLAELIIHRPKGANLALHGSVISSSRRPNSGPPQDLTNAKVEPAAAFATKDEPDPWVTLDLTAPARVSEVTLFNGDDHKDDSLPIRVETSADGATWDPAATQSTPFTQAAPAVLSFTARSARFVRVHGKPNGALFLSEVEVR